jgi:UDP-N-acetylmuramoyl-L-alanine---L-glutamate ligase
MHPLISWSALTSASVGLWGLGVEGRASLRRLESMGLVPVLVDDKPDGSKLGGLEILATDQGGLEALLACDVVIKSPGISRYRPEVGRIEAAGIPVRSGLGLWLEDVPLERVACITGTKGKSTTTAIAGHLLNQLGHVAKVGGNIGQPPWDPASTGDPEYWVIETSSYQVPDLTNGPPVVAVTSLSPDHLDWHGSVERYYADKLALCTKTGVRTAIAEGSNATLRAQAGALGPHVQWVDAGDPGFGGPWVRALGLPGEHNMRNAAMARAVLRSLGVVEAEDDALMEAAAEGFRGLPSRCHSIGHVGPVEFIDDGLSTNPLPAQAALEAYGDRPVALLVGGHDRGLDYAPLGHAVARRTVPTLVVTMPANGPRIGSAIREVVGNALEVIDAAGLEEAVTDAWAWARNAGNENNPVVLLSPAAPSFGRYTDYRERSRAFAEAAAACGPLT